jgi:hypothetical protein
MLRIPALYVLFMPHRMILLWTDGTAWWVNATEHVGRIIIVLFQREDVYKHFRFTSRASWISLTGLVLVPGALLYWSAQQDVRHPSTSIVF